MYRRNQENQCDLLRQAELDLKEYEAFRWHDEVNSLQGLQ